MQGLRFRVARWVAVRDKDGKTRPPGGTTGIVLVEPNGSTTAVLCGGDAVEVIHGKRELLTFSTTPANALRLAWFLVWTWWVKATWFGLKLRLWSWALAAPLPKSAPIKAPGFRESRFLVAQRFNEGFDPDGVAREFAKELKPNG